ncbi:MAG: sensor histidine kinase [Caulobacteraceae bacterium]
MLALTNWFWLAGVVAAALVAVFWGGEARDVAAAAALALAPVLTGFILLPWLRHRWASLGLILVWLTAEAGLVAGTGGAASPLAVSLVLAPLLALTLGRWTRVAGAGAVLAYLAGGYFARFDPGSDVGPFPVLLSAAALAVAGWMVAAARHPSGQREQAMSARVGEVSHELRTPLTHILGFSEMIERRIFGELNERYVEYAGLIRKSGGHLLGLVNDLLDLSRIEAGRFDLQFETFDARLIVEEVVRLSMDSADKKQIALGMLTPETPLNVRADESALRRMLINTVGNAIKFTPEGGRVMVQAAAADGALRLDTIDNGPGIPEAERETLGQAYERGSGGARAEGTGLGLSLVRALAGLHGGGLSFHEAPGGGALVRITLPVLAD